jgi:hypothetical protein
LKIIIVPGGLELVADRCHALTLLHGCRSPESGWGLVGWVVAMCRACLSPNPEAGSSCGSRQDLLLFRVRKLRGSQGPAAARVLRPSPGVRTSGALCVSRRGLRLLWGNSFVTALVTAPLPLPLPLPLLTTAAHDSRLYHTLSYHQLFPPITILLLSYLSNSRPCDISQPIFSTVAHCYTTALLCTALHLAQLAPQPLFA